MKHKLGSLQRYMEGTCRIVAQMRSAVLECRTFKGGSYNSAMSGSPALYGSESMRAEKRGVAGNSVLAAIAVTALKIAVGLATGSLGILSEAAHSGLDLVAAVITLFSVQVSDKPADADHQYGHGKVENFSPSSRPGCCC